LRSRISYRKFQRAVLPNKPGNPGSFKTR
jgi:hypothetical protein